MVGFVKSGRSEKIIFMRCFEKDNPLRKKLKGIKTSVVYK